MSNTPTFALLGCGQRGRVFADWLLNHPHDGRIVAVAEPDDERRNLLGDKHDIAEAMRFKDWRDLLAQPKLADAVINALMDQVHRDSSLAALAMGYHMMLEKPMAVTLQDCVDIDEARRTSGAMVCVCHSMRYHSVYVKVKELLDAGYIGEVVSIDQMEGVDPVHHAHSFVRGNWHREENSTFMLMAKSCHDIDVLYYLAGGHACRRVSSFGSLSHFTLENAPEGSPERCLDGCPVEEDCPYSVNKVYLGRSVYANSIGIKDWPDERIVDFLGRTDYGRCVYRCDNDVVDHQVVIMEFDNDATATFTMTAFADGRHLRINGTRGFIRASIDGGTISMHEFWRGMKRTKFVVPKEEGTHGGADDNIMTAFVAALRSNDHDAILTPADESLRSHSIVFAAEESRRTGKTVELG